MPTPHEPGASAPHHDNRHRRKVSLRRSEAATRKKRKPFQPALLGLEKRMLPATFLVSTAADSGAGSLRQAILNSNSTPGSNTIDFGIGTGAQTISLLSALPNITVPVLIDGTTQPGYTSAPLIDLDGTGAGSTANGLDLAAGSGGSTIRALVINNFAAAGISITTTDNIILSSYIGTNAAGSASGAEAMQYGIQVSGANNTIGGTTSGAGNLISGKTTYGIPISGSDNLVEDNRIGTDITGTVALGNGSVGVIISGGANNTIGGTAAAARNLISGNSSFGVEIGFSGATGNVVEGNLIGTNAAGTVALPNLDGVVIVTTSHNTIGGATPGEGNLISGNTDDGISLQNGSDNLVAGNMIGTDITGKVALPNEGGVSLDNTTGNTIGGTTSGAGNLISGNTSAGVDIGSALSTGNVVEGNKIGTDITGTHALANSLGVEVEGEASDNTIGGLTGTPGTGAGNLISGNGSIGVYLGSETGTVIAGNLIGTDMTGRVALPNFIGIQLDPGALNNTIGGTAAGLGNLISGNSNAGILVGGTDTGNVIASNQIGTDSSGTFAA